MPSTNVGDPKSEERWSEHITAGHKEFIGKEKSVIAAVYNPKVVITQSSDRKVFYDNSTITAMPPLFTAVVVQYTSVEKVDKEKKGCVITAHLTKNLKDTNYENVDIRRI